MAGAAGLLGGGCRGRLRSGCFYRGLHSLGRLGSFFRGNRLCVRAGMGWLGENITEEMVSDGTEVDLTANHVRKEIAEGKLVMRVCPQRRYLLTTIESLHCAITGDHS